MKRALALIFVLMLGACGGFEAIAPIAPEKDDAEAKAFAPIAGKSVIYVYHPQKGTELFAVPLSLNGDVAGRAPVGTFFRWIVPPGAHTVTAERIGFFPMSEPESVEIQAEDNGLYFVQIDAVYGLVEAIGNLTLVDEETGRAGVRQAVLLTNLFHDPPQE